MNPAGFPEKLRFLFQPSRYKVAYGGRGGTKSWGFARALLLLGIHKKLRVLCTREIQDSIKASVHQLLKDQIQLLGIGNKYRVLENEIRGTNGTQFMFAGLSSMTADQIKSFEAIDIAWIEEGQTISSGSLGILIPTIRKDDKDSYSDCLECSEIWISFNPILETDPVYDRFILNPPPGTVSVLVNWRDNPWWNEVLEAERLYDKQHEPKPVYENRWEGKCLPAVEGAIFFEEIQAMKRDQRIRNVPYDPMLLAHVVLDLGWGDAMTVSIVQKMVSEIRVIWYREFINVKLSKISVDLKELGYNWGRVWLPFADGFSKSSRGQDSAEEIMTKLKWDVVKKQDVSPLGVEAGIRVTRERFPRMYWDQTQCKRLVECASRYRRSINQATMEAGAPLHDEWCHGGDNIRYIAINVDSMTNVKDRNPRPFVRPFVPTDEGVGY